jgi:hypothetical protein
MSGGVLYQRNRVIPTPHFLIKAVRLMDPIDFIHDQVQNGTKFLRNFEPDVKKVFAVLDSEPRLYADFQVVLVGSGDIYHLDFDRYFQGTEGTKEKYVSPEKQKKYSMQMLRFFTHLRNLIQLKEKGMLDKYIEQNYDDYDHEEKGAETEHNDEA